MPIYEYRCSNGHTFDVLQRMTDDPLTTCQECGAPVERLFRAPAVHFKGSGFYNTDYGTRKRIREKEQQKSSDSGSGDSSKPSSEKAKSDSSSKSDSSKSSSSDSKAAA